MSRWLTLAAVLAVCVLVACNGTLQMGVEGGPTPDHAATITALATENVRLATRQATPAAPPSGFLPVPPGLVYRFGDSLYRVGADRQPVALIDRPDAVLSPDGSRALYVEGDDLWVADLASGQRRNLTNTPDRFECCARWWPQRPGVILFSVRPQEMEPGPGVTGFGAAVNVDGSGYRVLDEQHQSAGTPAASPDGRTLAYGSGEKGWLYRWDTGPEPFDPAAYGLEASKGVHVGSPAWSPDGRYLAWVAGGGFGAGGNYRVGVSVFNLQARQAWVLHPYEPSGRGSWPAPPAWSADGRWLAFYAHDRDAARSGLWVLRADGSQAEEHHFEAATAVWSPEGRWLAYMDARAKGAPGLRLAEVDTWKVQRGDLAPEVALVAWMEAGW
ncbi:MAG: hypothetical protein QME94_09005 [Anaerolineae bacterium]|nr:hypothetical protein [Anaerolineae bacterium]